MVTAQMVVYSVPISAGELGSAIGDDMVGDAVFANHILEKQTGQLRLIYIISARLVDRHHFQSIRNY